MATKLKPNRVFWIVGALALLWYIVGIIVLFKVKLAPEFIINEIPDIQLEFIENKPNWVTFCFGLSVCFGFLASILLLARSKFAYPIYIISFIGAIIQMAYNIITINLIDVYGKVGVALVIITLFINIFLIIFTKTSKKFGILN